MDLIFSNNLLTLKFVTNDKNEIRLSYLGDEKNYLNNNETSPIVECQTSEGVHNGSHCEKHLLTSYGLSYKYLSHSLKELENKKQLTITTSDGSLFISTTYTLYNDTKAATVTNLIENKSDRNITIEYISSFYLYGFSGDNFREYKNMYLHIPSNSWHCEAQWKRSSFLDLGIFNGNDGNSMKSFSINNTGSWSTKDNLPMCIVENAKEKKFLLTQVENNGSWHIEVGDFNNKYYLSASGPDFHNNSWCKTLKPSDSFESVPTSFSIGSSFEEVIQEITKERRIVIKKGVDYNELPVIFNDYMHATWDNSGEKLIWPLVDIAAEVGCEEFCMDAGWFDYVPWCSRIGEWEELKELFPTGGLKGTCDYIRSKGMKVGLWFEIENMGVYSKLANEFPDEYFFLVNGKRRNLNGKYSLNFANEKVYKWAFDLMSDRIERYGLDYIKLDYNLCTGAGNEWQSDSLGDGLLKHSRAVIKFYDELQNKYPNLTIENCGSGGCRMDYAMLKLCPIQSTSDQTDYKKYPYLSSNVLTACTPEQAAVWSYPVNKQIKDKVTDEVVAMNMVNAMLGRIHLASYINELTPFQLDIVKEGVKYYKSIRELKKGSLPIYPNGIAYFFDKEVVGGLIKNKKIVLCVWNTSGRKRTIKVNLEKYKIKDLKVSYPLLLETDYKYENGILEVSFSNPYGGRVFEINLI